MCVRVGADCFSVVGRCDCDCGVTVRAGLTLIGLGVGSAAVFQHLDSLIFGGFLVLVGLWVLTVKEPVR